MHHSKYKYISKQTNAFSLFAWDSYIYTYSICFQIVQITIVIHKIQYMYMYVSVALKYSK